MTFALIDYLVSTKDFMGLTYDERGSQFSADSSKILPARP
jgi:hypothetical protein